MACIKLHGHEWCCLSRVALKGVALNCGALNGVALNGVALNGVALNCVALNGVVLNDVALNGVAVNCVALKSVTLNWLSISMLFRPTKASRFWKTVQLLPRLFGGVIDVQNYVNLNRRDKAKS